VAGGQENHVESMAYEEQALQLSRLFGDVAKESLVLGNMAVSLAALGDLVGRQHYQMEALAIRRRLNLPSDICMIVGELGYTSIELGDYVSAESLLTEAFEIAMQIRDEFWQAWVKLRLGQLWDEEGDLEKSMLLITEAFQTVEKLQRIPLQARVLYDWGNLLISSEDWKGAEQKFQGAYDLWHGRGNLEYALLALAGLAYATYQQEEKAPATAHAENLWKSLQESPEWAERANLKLYWMLGMVWQGLRDNRADKLWKKAHTLLQQRSEKIEDKGARQMYLENVSAHRAILNHS
jgi:tetratricopeptide (TPR) repeat protein